MKALLALNQSPCRCHFGDFASRSSVGPKSHFSTTWSKVWPIDINLKFIEPVGRELQSIGKFMDSAVNLMNASFQDR